jgi:UDP-GlcNAc:undecaprenyl-phosphate GlcNAc-1-phosphate transferase
MDWVGMWSQLEPRMAWRALAAFALVAVLIPLVLPLARRWQLCDVPGGRKQHATPTPFIGGAVILVVVALLYLGFDSQLSVRLGVFVACGALLIVTGLVDDRIGLSWRVRFAVQVAVALAIVYGAGVQVQNLGDVFGVDELYLGWVGVPFTVFVVVGCINAVNMADGSDGLAAGQVLAAVLLFAAFALYSGALLTLERLLVVAGAVAGFLVWNLRFPWQPRARVFLGNAGSMFLGFLIAWTAIRLTQNADHPVTPVLGPWVIALPLMDCVARMFARVQAHRSPFAADRTHLHHLLLDAGWSPNQVAWGAIVVSLVLGTTAAIAVKLGTYRPLLVIAFLLALGAYYRFTVDRDAAVATLRKWRGVPDVAPAPEPLPMPMPRPLAFPDRRPVAANLASFRADTERRQSP